MNGMMEDSDILYDVTCSAETTQAALSPKHASGARNNFRLLYGAGNECLHTDKVRIKTCLSHVTTE